MKQLILLCAVAVGGPVFDKKGAVESNSETLLPAGTVAEFEDAEADRLVALGAARLPVDEAVADSSASPAPPPPTT